MREAVTPQLQFDLESFFTSGKKENVAEQTNICYNFFHKSKGQIHPVFRVMQAPLTAAAADELRMA